MTSEQSPLEHAHQELERAHAGLADRSEFVQAVLDSVAVGIVACDGDGHLTLFNHATRDFHGIPADSTLPTDEWAGHFDLFQPDGTTPLQPDQIPLVVALRQGVVADVEMVIAPHGLPSRLVRCDGRALHGPDGATVGAVVAMTDITAARESERGLRAAHEALRISTESLARSEAQFRAAFDHGPLAMCRLDAEGQVVQANPSMRRLLGPGSGALVGRRLTALVVPTDRERLSLALAATGTSTTQDTGCVEVRVRRTDRQAVWCELAVSDGVDQDGQPFQLVQLADVDDRKRRESDLERRAAHDELTGLSNRATLLGRLSALLAPRAVADDGATTVLYLDLDAFKEVNDGFGHQIGDEVLVEVARRLRAAVRPQDMVARLGGDEFVVVRRDDDGLGEQRAGDLVERVRHALQGDVPTSAGPQRVGVSIGLALGHPGEQPDAVLARADRAMYAHKRAAAARPTVPAQLRRGPVED